MPESPLFSAYRQLAGNLMKTLTLDDVAYQLCSFLMDMVPSDRMLWYAVDRRVGSMDVLIDYTRGAPTRSYSRSIPRLLQSRGMRALRHPRYNDILLCPHAPAVPEVYRYMRDAFGSVYNSFLCLLLPAEDEPEQLHAVFWMSLDPDNYTEKSVDLVAVSCLLASERDPIALAMIDEGTVDLSAESLLRRCKGLRATMEQVDAVAGTRATVLLHGPSGVGKELFAEAIHALSSARHGPLVRVNCGAMTESLMDSEFFGHEKGAFTGAATAHAGFFEQARGGTLFLDEVGELSPPAQLRLLRVLESGEIRRVGGSRNIPVDVRVVSASHRDLWDMVHKGTFREDLLFRLEVFPIEVPSLAERREDIPLLAEHFYHTAVRGQRLEAPPQLTGEFMAALQNLSWPGNVRQLRHAVERAVIVSHAKGRRTLVLADQDAARLASGMLLNSRKKRGRPAALQPSPERIRAALASTGNRIQGENGAAALLDLPPSTLRKHMRALGIPLPRQQSRHGAKECQEGLRPSKPPRKELDPPCPPN